MATNEYHFITCWRVEGTVEEVAGILGDATGLGRWWPAVYLDVRELKPGDERGIGKEVTLYTKGWLPYTLRWSFRVVESNHPYGFTLEAWGDFTGRGIWTLAQDGPYVEVTYDWRVRADKPLLRRLSFLLKPIFSANHRWAMARGEESLRLELARRHATTPEARARIPDPPRPTAVPLAPVLLGATAAIAAGLAVRSLLRRSQSPGDGAMTSRRPTSRRPTFRFNPERVAHFEAAGWRAYYERRWLKLLRLIVALGQEQFRIPFPQSLQAAYYVTRAAAAWVPIDHDTDVVRRYYERFYQLARRYSGLRFEPARVADLELQYNDVHRRLSGQADKRAFLRTMVELHSATFGLSPDQARESAAWRVLANNTVDRITAKLSQNVEGDWARLEEYLRRCYRSIQRELNRKR
ncbi:MAG: SRPBCC family protein [Chloroflexota bacterium]